MLGNEKGDCKNLVGGLIECGRDNCFCVKNNLYYPLANEVAMGYSNTTDRPSFRNILVYTLESTSFNGF